MTFYCRHKKSRVKAGFVFKPRYKAMAGFGVGCDPLVAAMPFGLLFLDSARLAGRVCPRIARH